MSGYLSQNEYFGNSYWGQWYWGTVGTKYREIFRATVIINYLVAAASIIQKIVAKTTFAQRDVSGSVIMNIEVPGIAEINKTVGDTYQELEKE